MFKAIKDSWFFSKMANLAMDRYGMNMMKADRATGGLVNDACVDQRAHGFTHEESAAACVALSMLYIVETVDSNYMQADYSKIMEFEKTILILSAQGIIRDSVLEYVREMTDRYCDIVEEKTGVSLSSV